MTKLKITQIDGNVVFTVKVVPGSSKTVLSGLLDDMLKVKVAAAPEKGKANQCLTEYLAKVLGVKKKAVEIIAGKTCPVKQLRVSGVSIEQVVKSLGIGEV